MTPWKTAPLLCCYAEHISSRHHVIVPYCPCLSLIHSELPMNHALADENRLQQPKAISMATAFWYWLKLGFISFGGPAGQIALMHTELVERRRWISEQRFLHALNYCMVQPGPEAQQHATYIGWLKPRTAGGIIAGAWGGRPARAGRGGGAGGGRAGGAGPV